MKASELIRMVKEQHERIEQLERKVRELEMRPPTQIIRTPYTGPVWIAPRPWDTTTQTFTDFHGHTRPYFRV